MMIFEPMGWISQPKPVLQCLKAGGMELDEGVSLGCGVNSSITAGAVISKGVGQLDEGVGLCCGVNSSNTAGVVVIREIEIGLNTVLKGKSLYCRRIGRTTKSETAIQQKLRESLTSILLQRVLGNGLGCYHAQW